MRVDRERGPICPNNGASDGSMHIGGPVGGPIVEGGGASV